MTGPEARLADRTGAPPEEDLRAFEQLLAELSAGFINLPADQVDAAITDALRRIVDLLGLDRSSLGRLSPETGEALITHAWAAPDIDLGPPPRRPNPLAYPWCVRRAASGQPVVLSRLDELPPEARIDKETLQRVKVKSVVAMPMTVGGKVEGLINFGTIRRERAWSEDLVARFRVLADIFGNALAHKRAQEALDRAMEFEQLVSRVFAALLRAAPSELDRVIEAGLRDAARCLGADRATLWRYQGPEAELQRTHRWTAESTPLPFERPSTVVIPWISARLAAGAVVRVTRLADLPPEAAADLRVLQNAGLRSGMIAPLAIAGNIVGALSFGCVVDERDWPEALVPRVQLLGEVFASVLARREAQQREELAKAEAAHAARVTTMGAFAASLAHELTQPVAAIRSNAETAARLLALPQPGLAEARSALEDILTDDQRAGDLIQKLRRFLRRGEIERDELALPDVLEEVVHVATAEAIARGVAFTAQRPWEMARVTGDRVQLQQVLLNLLLNAFDAVSSGQAGARRVEMRAGPCACGVSIEVHDSGTGMDGEVLARIFEPFFTTKPRGMGLGLSISRTIAEAHGGTLSARSTPGAGSTFRFELPALPPADTAPAHRTA
jgi:C4-dicarboxylate-specific signal transduction histidine kinase